MKRRRGRWFRRVYWGPEVRHGGFLSQHVVVTCPPDESEATDTRYLDIRDDDKLDEAQNTSWLKRASKLPWVRSAGPARAGRRIARSSFENVVKSKHFRPLPRRFGSA